jgi:uncharacterized protein (TIGR02118 family)
MIHQLIFAAPKPGLTEQQFQDYWINVHAVKYASKIPQIKQYSVSARLPSGFETGEPLWSGIADIWLENEAEQLASLQTPEFLQGARLDEPNWAAFWRTVVLDTDAHVLKDGGGLAAVADGVKVVVLVKRRWGLPVEEHRRYALETHAPLALKLPGLRRYVQCFARDGLYSIGEPMFDGAALAWFDSPEAAQAAADSQEGQAVRADLPNFLEPKYIHTLLTREHWVIGPLGSPYD